MTQVAEPDEQVIDFLKEYGKIERMLFVDDPLSEFYKNLIVEYSSSTALESLEPRLPYTCTARGDSANVYEVKTLSSAYTTKVGSHVTKTYLAELKELAKLSGKDYGELLREVMSQIGRDVEVMRPNTEESSPTHVETTVSFPPTPKERQPQTSFLDVLPSNSSATDHIPLTSGGRPPSLSVSDINPSGIQKVVVEHIIQGQDVVTHMQPQVRLRSFSGKTPRPNNETDYDTWCAHIELLQNDPSMSPLKISRKIFESLLPPAADVVKGLRSESPPTAYLQLLDSAFGTVEYGEELFVQFLNTLQDPGTNTLDILFDIYSEADLTCRQALSHGYKVVFKVIELRRKQATNNHQGVVKIQGKTRQVIPAGKTVVVEGVALVSGLQDEKSVVIEYPSSSPLLGGQLVKAGLVDFPQLWPHKLPVIISNESDHDVVIPAKCTIAEVSAHQTIL
ncbi:hypothetical protein AOLI_G00126690 [Acnodon oligacanthus]